MFVDRLGNENEGLLNVESIKKLKKLVNMHCLFEELYGSNFVFAWKPRLFCFF